MKKKDIVILIIGVTSLVLMIVFKLIAGVSAVRTFGAEGGWQAIKDWFRNNGGDFHVEILDPLDIDDAVIIGNPDKVHLDENGVYVTDDGDKIVVKDGKVEVDTDEDKVRIDKDGIFIANDEHEIKIGTNGISVE